MANQELLAFIAEESGKGVPEAEIREKALQKGWSAEDVNGALASHRLRQSPLHGGSDVYVAPPTKGTPVDVSLLVAFILLAGLGLVLYKYAPTLATSAQLALSEIVGTSTPLTNAPFVPFAPEPNTYAPDTVSHALATTNTPKVVTTVGTAAPSAQPVAPTPTPTNQPTPTPVAATPPSITIGADSTVVRPNAPVTLSWSATNATACQSNGSFVTNDATSGVVVVRPLLSTSFGIECVGPGGKVEASIYVRTSGAPIENTPGGPIATPTTPSGPGSPTFPDVPPPPTLPDLPTPPSSPTPPAAPPSAPSIPVGTYAVYPGCEAPQTSGFATTMYIDPANGSDTGDGSAAHPYKTLATVLAQKKLNTNTHVVLLPGDHGKVFADGVYGNAQLASGSGWVWLDFRPGAYAEYLYLRNNLHEWLITNATLTDPAQTNQMLALFAGVHNFILADSFLYTALDASGWNATQWIAADNGISSDNSTCVAILRNTLKNIRFGIQVSTRAGSTDPTANSIKVLAEDNLIQNFSGDGMRPVGSDIIFYHNAIYDEYVSAADGDGNHDDGMQGFALNGAVYSNVTIDHNWVQESTNPSRAYNAGLQGISSFDGLYENLRITNNVVLASAYHGISWYGVHDALIDHNTVINPTSNGHKLWIIAPVGKSGGNPSNVTISNNIAELLSGAPTGVTFVNNSAVFGKDPTTLFVAFDPAHNNFNLQPKPGGILDGKNQGADLYTPILAQSGRGITSVIAEVPAPAQSPTVVQVHTPSQSKLVAAVDATTQSTGNFLSRLWDWLLSVWRRFFG